MANILDRSHVRTENGLPHFQIPEIAQLGWVKHAFMTRKGGVSLPPYDSLNISPHTGDREDHVWENRSRIASTFHLSVKNLVLLHQVHQDRALVLKDPISSLPPMLDYDALITNVPGLCLGIRSADCIPILLVDPQKKIVAAIHAGRQGTGLQIAPKVLRTLETGFGCAPDDLLAAIGPGVEACCYEIDEHVFMPAFEPYATYKGDGRWDLDLAAMNISQLEGAGVQSQNIFHVNVCTRCHSDLFFSYRREGKTGTQLSFIGMRGE